jgi:phosphate transport system protein
MERHFDEELEGLKHQLLKMGGHAELMVEEAVKALVRNEPAVINSVMAHETIVNQLQISIDEDCLRLLALYQPAAGDLRFLLGVAKINTELERLGDHAVNIAEIVRRLLGEPQVKPFDVIPQMVNVAVAMAKNSLHAFVNRDVGRAREVLLRDDTLDDLRDRIIAELIGYMQRDPATIVRAVNLISVAKNLERIGDLATNIAEDVIFVVEGKDVRHQFGKHVEPPPAAGR